MTSRLGNLNTKTPSSKNDLNINTIPTQMASSVPLQIAETIQTASINRTPSPSHDLNPSTAASKKEPVTFTPRAPASDSSLDKFAYDDEDGIEQDDEEDIPYGVLKPTPRRQSFGPLPDLRFEQSYLASIAGADTKWKVIAITVRDQVCYHTSRQYRFKANEGYRYLCR